MRLLIIPLPGVWAELVTESRQDITSALVEKLESVADIKVIDSAITDKGIEVEIKNDIEALDLIDAVVEITAGQVEALDEQVMSPDELMDSGELMVGAGTIDEGAVSAALLREQELLSEKRLSYKARERLPDSVFVYPDERRYPINDIAHARNALARVSAHGTPAEQAKVKRAVYKKFPELKPEKDEALSRLAWPLGRRKRIS